MQLGIIVSSYNMSDLCVNATKNINMYLQYGLESKEHLDVILFCDKRLNVATDYLPCASMPMYEIWGFKGDAISTDINSTISLLNCHTIKNKYFYIWDLEWMGINNQELYDIDSLCDIYMNPELKLIARSKEHYDIITSCWKEPVGIVEGFNYEELTQVIS